MFNTSLLTHTARHTQLAQNLLLIKARNLFTHLSIRSERRAKARNVSSEALNGGQ